MTAPHQPKENAGYLFNSERSRYVSFVNRTTQVDAAIQYLLSAIPEKLAATPRLDYLDVGCGYGNKTTKIIACLRQLAQRVHTVALDPSAELLSQFANVSSDADIVFENMFWHDYQGQQQFDLITSIHTFYYMDDWLAAVEKMLAYCKPEGKACIVIRQFDDICRFKTYVANTWFEGERVERTAERLCEILDHHRIPFRLDGVTSRLDVRDAIADTPQGRELVEFLLRIDSIDMTPEMIQGVRDYLTQHSDQGFLTHHDAFIWLG